MNGARQNRFAWVMLVALTVALFVWASAITYLYFQPPAPPPPDRPPVAGTPNESSPPPTAAPTNVAFASGPTISLASWNIRNLSHISRSDAELGIISLVLFRYDFIALQEVLDAPVLERVQAILKRDFQADYQFIVSEPVGRVKKERYAFFWRADKIQLIVPGAIVTDPEDHFEREPFYASFRAGQFDFTVCTIHVLFGKNEAERRPELLRLDDVYRDIRDAGAEKDIILCGDFNFGPDDAGWAELKAEDGMRFAIGPPHRTTIGGKSLFDNFWWPTAAREVVPDSGQAFCYDEAMYPPGALKEANRLTSDHRPISIRARIDLEDDD